MQFLVVDDDVVMRHVVRVWLGRAFPGVPALEAHSGERALELLPGIPRGPLVVVSDLRMPGGMDGLALLAEIRRRRPDAARVLLTGVAPERIPPSAGPDAPHALLDKAVSPEEFARVLLSLTGRAES